MNEKESEISQRDVKLLEALLDGELSESQAQSLQTRIGNDPSLAAEYEMLRDVRIGVRQWFQTQQSSSSADLWSSIEGDIQAAAERRQNSWWRPIASQLFGEAQAAFVLKPQFMGAAAFAAVVAVVVVNTEQRAQEMSPRAPSQVASSQSELPVMPVSTNSRTRGQAAPFRLSDSARVAYQQSLQSHKGLQFPDSELPTSISLQRKQRMMERARKMAAAVTGKRLIGERLVLGGMRASGADIDWVQSEQPFRIVPGENRSAPPIIWIDSSKQK